MIKIWSLDSSIFFRLCKWHQKVFQVISLLLKSHLIWVAGYRLVFNAKSGNRLINLLLGWHLAELIKQLLSSFFDCKSFLLRARLVYDHLTLLHLFIDDGLSEFLQFSIGRLSAEGIAQLLLRCSRVRHLFKVVQLWSLSIQEVLQLLWSGLFSIILLFVFLNEFIDYFTRNLKLFHLGRRRSRRHAKLL